MFGQANVVLKETRVIGTTTLHKRNRAHHGAWPPFPGDLQTSLTRLSELQVRSVKLEHKLNLRSSGLWRLVSLW